MENEIHVVHVYITLYSTLNLYRGDVNKNQCEDPFWLFLLDFKCPACSKIEERLSIKSIEVY